MGYCKTLGEDNKWFIVFLSVFLLVEILSPFTWKVIGDEQVYYYMGKLVSQGLIPYKDFFYAHPPLQLYLYALLFKVVDYNFYIFKIGAILLTCVNFCLFYTIVKRDFNKNIALIASIISMFSLTTLYNSSFEYGLTLAMFLFLVGLLHTRLRLLWFILASFVRFHMVFFVISFYIHRILFDTIGDSDKTFVKINIDSIVEVWAYTNLFLILNITLNFIFPDYTTATFLYHILKPKMGIQAYDTLLTILKFNYLAVMMFVSYVLSWRHNPKVFKYMFIAFPFALLLGFTKNFFGYYFILLVPFVAVVSAYELSKNKYGLVWGALLGYYILVTILYYISLSTSLSIQTLDIKQHVNIIGDPPTVSYLALTNKDFIMGNNVDLNSMLYESHIKNIQDLIYNIKFQHPTVIIKPDEGLYARNKPFKEYVNGCLLLKEVQNYKIYKC